MLKRLFDVLAAGALLIAATPFLCLVAVAVWIDSGRPIVFSQTRSGRHGTPFTLYKFRTLHPNTGLVDAPRDYTTCTGRWLRRWGVDELPQLWNVLRGDMSLVGPRPTLPQQVTRYGAFERQRLAVRPGLTGWAQVHGRNAIPWPERIDLDVWYVHHHSLWLDLHILLRTPRAVLLGTGVYGRDGRNLDYP
jgi:lipopolysaccharide/colanic/teichoic acid biosynthesis glycosyltransferase